MSPRSRFLALLVVSPALLVGCDAVADLAGVNEFDVNTGAAATLDLTPEAAVASSASVDINQNLPDLFDVERISVPANAVTYTPAASITGSSAAVCHVDFYVMVDEVPALQGSLEVDEEATPRVRDLTTRYAQPFDREAICAGLGDGDCPVTTAAMTSAEIRDHVDDAVQSGAFTLDLVAENHGPCEGTLAIERLHFELDF